MLGHVFSYKDEINNLIKCRLFFIIIQVSPFTIGVPKECPTEKWLQRITLNF